MQDLDRKIVRIKRKNAKIEEQFKLAEKTIPDDNTEFGRRKEELSSQIKLEHSVKIAEAIYQEQNRTEDIMTEALTQLVTFVKGLYGSGSNKEELEQFSVSR